MAGAQSVVWGQSEAREEQESAYAGPGSGQSLRAGGFKQGIGIIRCVFYEVRQAFCNVCLLTGMSIS